jgi:hypothetical protein
MGAANASDKTAVWFKGHDEDISSLLNKPEWTTQVKARRDRPPGPSYLLEVMYGCCMYAGA